MKNILLTAITAVICGSTLLSAEDVTKLRVGLADNAPKTLAPQPVAIPQIPALAAGKRKDAVDDWYVINVPVQFVGTAPSSKEKNAWVTDVTLRIHLRAEGKDGKSVHLTKTLALSDVPLRSGSGDKGSFKGSYNVGIFLPQRSYEMIAGSEKGKIKVFAYAVEAAFNGEVCKRPKDSVAETHDSSVKLKPTWYKRSKSKESSAKVYAISETPFAPYYGAAYPRPNPIYGAPVVDESVFGKGDEAGDDASESSDAES